MLIITPPQLNFKKIKYDATPGVYPSLSNQMPIVFATPTDSVLHTSHCGAHSLGIPDFAGLHLCTNGAIFS
jgi:hypothetical protein